MFAAYTRAILAHRGVALLLLVVAVGAVAAGALRLGVDFSVREFFGTDDVEVAYLDEYQARWHEDDMLVIVVDGGEQGLLTRERLEEIDGVVDQIAKTQGVAGVQGLTRLPRANRVAGMFIPVPLLSTAPKDPADTERLEAWKQRLLADPQVVPLFLSKDGRHGSILVKLDVKDVSDLAEIRPIVHRVRDLLAGLEDKGVQFHVAGIPAIRADILDVIVKDQLFFVPIAGFIMAAVLYALFRSKHGVLIPGLSAGVPTLMLLGLMGWTGMEFGLLNQVFLVLVPTMAVAESVHLVSRFHEELKKTAGTAEKVPADLRNQAIVTTMSVMGVACFLTSFTTVQGFASLYTAHLPVLKWFGVYAAVGILFSYFTMLFIVPLALTMTKTRVFDTQDHEQGVFGQLLVGIANLTTRHPWLCIGVTVAVTAGGAWAGTLVKADWRINKTYNEDHPITVANHVVDDHLGGLLALEFDLQGPAGAFADPAVLNELATFEQQQAKLPGVRATISPATLLRATSTLLGGPDAVPADPSTLERLFGVLRQSQALDAFVTPERDHARLLVRTVDLGSIAFLQLGRDMEQDLARRLEPHGIKPHLTGTSYVAARGMNRVSQDLYDSLMSGSLAILLVIAFLFRSLLQAILSMVPNVITLVIGYGAMGLLGWPLEPAPAVVFTIAIGLAVDSAIHVLARFDEERRAGKTVDEAIHAAILHSGRAILVTSLLVVLGFAINAFSSSPATAAFGKLGTLIIVVGLFANVIVLPAMLKVGYGGRDKKAEAVAKAS